MKHRPSPEDETIKPSASALGRQVTGASAGATTQCGTHIQATEFTQQLEVIKGISDELQAKLTKYGIAYDRAHVWDDRAAPLGLAPNST